MRPAGVVYAGPGAGTRSALSAISALNAALGPAVTVTTVTRPAALAGADWHAGTAAIVFPGGADSPYARDLAGPPNASIRAYCEAGGAYIGLCAGAYYGCASLDFEPGTPLAVAGDRELAFFHGRALGAAVPGFAYETEAGAAAVTLAWRRHDDREGEGGGWRAAVDYCNGGPVFVAPDGARLPDADPVRGVTVLARYAGGVVDAGDASPAVAAAAAGGAAALRCAVGDGVAVLCGTHPELTPAGRWLEGAPAGLVGALEGGEAGRGAFWGGLLEAAGLKVKAL